MPVRSMTADAIPQEIAPHSHLIFSKSDRSWNSLVMPTPMSAEKVCPKSALRGWPSGDRIELYSRIAEAPLDTVNRSSLACGADQLTSDAISTGGLCACMDGVLLKTPCWGISTDSTYASPSQPLTAMTAKPQNAPTKDQTAPKMLPTSCFCSFLYPSNLETGVGSLWSGEGGTTLFR